MVEMIKYILVLLILSFASCSDIKSHTIPSCVYIMLLIVGIFNKNLLLSISTFAFLFFVFVIMMIVFEKENIGGGDIKLLSALGFTIGLKLTIITIIIGLITSIAIQSTLINLGKTNRTSAYALVPYMTLGYIIALFIG